jgi:hypothetical protein
MILRDLGWRIRRVWSTEWWADAEAALVKLHDRLAADLEEDRRQAPATAANSNARSDLAIAAEAPAPEPAEEETQPDATPGASEHPGEIAAPLALPPPIEPIRPYADAVRRTTGSPPLVAIEYKVADLPACGLLPAPERFYDPLYRSTLRAMTACIVGVEGPVFADVLVTRIARAHGFARSGERIRETVMAAIERRFPTSEENGRLILWPDHADARGLACFRRSSPETREHSDIPIAELASLARHFLGDGADTEETVRRLAAYFGLSRLREATRARFAAAADRAQSDAIKSL